jgi:cytochrome c biogenesis protein CcmG, thiol:disulfide interchange protein DsbE
VSSSWDGPQQVDDDDADDADGEGVEGSRRGSRRGQVVATVLVVAVIAIGLVAVLATSEPAANRIASSPLVGQPAPAVQGTLLDGDAFDLGDESGRWTLVNFFATWCAPCRQEHDDLARFHERHQATGDAGVVSIVFNDEVSDARDFFDEFGAPFPVLVSDDGSIALDFGVAKVPESYLVAPDGTIVAKIIGGVTEEGLEELLARFAGAEP